MGKKVIKQRQALSSKISKKDHSKHQYRHQQQLDSLIEVLRPKVYITDSSSFKKLVQELTGNGNITSTSTPPPLHDDDHHQVQLNVETLSGFNITEAPNSASSSGLRDELQELDQFWNSEIMCLARNDAVSEDHPGLDVLGYHDDEINYIESLLFDEQLVEEQIPFYGQAEQDLSIYDYDFSGFIN